MGLKTTERRRFKRITIGFKAELISNGVNNAGVIEDLSEAGLCMITSPTKTAIDFIPGKVFEINFQPHSGEIINLHCKLKWASKTQFHGLTSRVGMEIINLPWHGSNDFV